MGDYGFKGAGEFGGIERNFNCLPDKNITNCPHIEQGLGGDFDQDYWCKLTEGPDLDMRGFGCDLCDYKGRDFTECEKYRIEHKIKK
jgi:hypothetical protein